MTCGHLIFGSQSRPGTGIFILCAFVPEPDSHGARGRSARVLGKASLDAADPREHASGANEGGFSPVLASQLHPPPPTTPVSPPLPRCRRIVSLSVVRFGAA